MEDIFKFLLLAVVIIIGFIKQARKESRNMKASPDDDDNIPQSHNTHPLPESWEGIPAPPLQPTDGTHLPKKEAEPFIPKSYQRQPNASHDRPAKQTMQTDRPETEDTHPAIDTQAADEIRKGIIWSEILQRKY